MAHDIVHAERPEWVDKLLHWFSTANHKEIGLLYLLTDLGPRDVREALRLLHHSWNVMCAPPPS